MDKQRKEIWLEREVVLSLSLKALRSGMSLKGYIEWCMKEISEDRMEGVGIVTRLARKINDPTLFNHPGGIAEDVDVGVTISEERKGKGKIY